jgi:Tfp pilus assembly protein PilV
VNPPISYLSRGRGRFAGRRTRQSGFTVVEGLIASVVLAISVVGLSGLISATANQSMVLDHLSTARSLARDLMEEIAAQPFLEANGSTHLGPETGETSRALITAADDYSGYSDTTQALQTLDGQTVALSNLLFTRSVAFQYRTTPTTASANVHSGTFALVTVTVTTPDNKVIQLSRLLSRIDRSS